jgi:hypothetical protein
MAWPAAGFRIALALSAALAVVAMVAGPAAARRAKHRPVTGLAGTLIYSGSISYTGDNTDQRVQANCGGDGSYAPESEHRTLVLHFTTTFRHVVLSINNGRKHNPVQALGGTTKLGRTAYTDRGTNYRSTSPDVDPGDCLSTQTKVTWNCSGRLARPGGSSLTLFSDITRFKFELNPISVVGATPGTCANAWYPQQDPLDWNETVYTDAGDFTGYWDNQGGFTPFGLLGGLTASKTLQLPTAKAWAALARQRVKTLVLNQAPLPDGFTNCSTADDEANVKDACEQTQDGHAVLKFIVSKALYN